MIRFVDINTGNVFNGEYPYIFWFEGEQGVDIFYSQPICFISHSPKVSVDLPNNEVFKLLKLKSWMKSEYCDKLEYTDINELIASSGRIELEGVQYNDYYVYIFYILASSNMTGEFTENFYLTEKDKESIKYKIGADFYGENEFNSINLLNNGIEIPSSIQKAIYPVNVHEDKKDNIVLNRKWKELLSNYWDVVANKGSYKSLYNALKWFEYGDIIKLYEIWKHEDMGMDIYDERELSEILGDKYFESLNGFNKTTYMAISVALEKILKDEMGVKYDNEKNPILEKISFDWSIQDLSLKLSMLGSFYKTYFMPIHLSCIRSTIENIIYSNTFKLQNAPITHREDIIHYSEDIKCNVKDGDIFRLDAVSAKAGIDTMFANKNIKDYNTTDIVGVDRKNPYFHVNDDMDNQLKVYLSQNFNAIGSIIDFEMEFPLQSGDFIKRSLLAYKGDKTNEWNTIIEHKIIKDKILKFSILCTKEQDYDFRFEFNTADGKVFTKRLNIHVIDTHNTSIKLYRVQNIGLPNLYDSGSNEYSFGRMLNNYDHNSNAVLYKQFIPCKNVDPYKTAYWDYRGVCLNHMMILKSNEPLDKVPYIEKNYFTTIREIDEDTIYTICLSKKFGFQPNRNQLNLFNIYREEYIFYPDFHELVPFESQLNITDLSTYTITDEDALCVIPDIPYGKLIDEAQWEFINVSTPTKESIIPPVDIKEPFIAPDTESFLKPGFYTILFRYRLAGENQINTITLDSAFLKK